MQLSTLCAYLSRRGRSFAWLLRRGALALAVLVLLWLLLELWPSAAHSTLVFCGRNLFLSWMEVSSQGRDRFFTQFEVEVAGGAPLLIQPRFGERCGV
jgi:hypothetical protein